VKNVESARAHCKHCSKILKVSRTTKVNLVNHLSALHRITQSQTRPKDSELCSDSDVEIVSSICSFLRNKIIIRYFAFSDGKFQRRVQYACADDRYSCTDQENHDCCQGDGNG
jgi:hypothetical protein